MSVGGFDAMYAAFRRSVSRCFERGGERWISSGLVLTRCTQRSGVVFRGVSGGEVSVGFRAVWFRREVRSVQAQCIAEMFIPKCTKL